MDQETEIVARKSLQAALHGKLAVAKPWASRLVNGHGKPSLELATQAERALSIPPRAWIDGTFLQAYWDFVRRGK